jgi:hypothetical protein
MEYATEIISGGVEYIPRFKKIDTGVRDFLGGIKNTDTHTDSKMIL